MNFTHLDWASTDVSAVLAALDHGEHFVDDRFDGHCLAALGIESLKERVRERYGTGFLPIWRTGPASGSGIQSVFKTTSFTRRRSGPRRARAGWSTS